MSAPAGERLPEPEPAAPATRASAPSSLPPSPPVSASPRAAAGEPTLSATRRDLTVVVLLGLAGLAVAFVGEVVWFRSLVLLPLILILPGYATAAVLFPAGTIGVAERSLYTLTLSIAIAGIGGLLLQLFIGLDRTSWGVLLAAVTVVIASAGLILGGERPAPQVSLPSMLPLVAAAFLLAGAIAALAIVSARHGLAEGQARIAFTDFWLVPTGPAGASSQVETLSVGLSSHERYTYRYKLRISRGASVIVHRKIELRPGHRWLGHLTVTAPPGGTPIVARLFREGELYRQLRVAGPA